VPHIIVEYSGDLTSFLDIDGLLDALHDAAMAHEALPVGGLRVRGHAASSARVGDGRDDRNFIYIIVRLGQGRSPEVRRDIGNTLFAVLTDYTAELVEASYALSLGLEVQEIEKDWTWKKNNIHQIQKDEI